MPAEQEVGYGPYVGKHLHIKVEPKEKKDFYFTDEKPIFDLEVTNIGNEEFNDDIYWFIGFPGGRETLGPVTIILKPKESKKYQAGGRLLGFPGTAALCIKIPDALPVRNTNNWATHRFHTLYTFEVYDRALFNREQSEKRKNLYLLIASLAVAFITLIVVIASLILNVRC